MTPILAPIFNPCANSCPSPPNPIERSYRRHLRRLYSFLRWWDLFTRCHLKTTSCHRLPHFSKAAQDVKQDGEQPGFRLHFPHPSGLSLSLCAAVSFATASLSALSAGAVALTTCFFTTFFIAFSPTFFIATFFHDFLLPR